MIVVTGKSGSGKTTLLKKTKLKNIHYLDDVIKKHFYKRNSSLYWQVKKEFGKSVTTYFKVKRKKLGKIVFNDCLELEKLNKIVEPFIKKYLKLLKEDKKIHIIEMATYINFENIYRPFFDKVILIKRDKNDLKNKFNYLKEKNNPIHNKEIFFTKFIKNDEIKKARLELINAIKY